MHRWLAAALIAGSVSACTPVMGGLEEVGLVRPRADRIQPAPEPPPPPSPELAPPGERGDSAVWREALGSDGARIVVSRELRRLWYMRGDSVVLTAPVAVGRDTIFEYGGQKYDFSTPLGRRAVQGKEESPAWVPPDWHYYEIAVERGLEPVQLKPDQVVELSDGTTLEVRGVRVGRVNRFGNWWEFKPGSEIIFDDRIFMPPFGSPQRRIPDVLGTHRLILGDGYLIHGTPETDSIGEWASHGCIRMFNYDVERLYGIVDLSTPVFIY